jgi:CPA2 family monovalent cation:H+ antiporter-2
MAVPTDIQHVIPGLSIAFALGSFLGFITYRLRLSPILGYMLAGYLVGPYSPGIVIDVQLSEQLAEIGVVLMMFGVGVHFKWQDLTAVRYVATFGALGQTVIASIVGALLLYGSGYPLSMGLIIGFAVSVASTVVLVRMLGDNNLLDTPQGNLTIGWLVIEDLFTVALLVLLPLYAQALAGQGFSWLVLGSDMAIIAMKFVMLAVGMFTVGKWIVSKLLYQVARVQSHELFTLAVLALTFVIAAGAATVFGTSIALGAFIAGMVIGQTALKHQATANALPIRDAFVGLFFLSVGMLFNPEAIYYHPSLFIIVFLVVTVVKPLAAYAIVLLMKQPPVAALTVALGLAQIGEFSFILAEEALKLKILPDEGYDIIVAVALVSIALNPLLFRFYAKQLVARNEPADPPVADDLFVDHLYSQKLRAVIVGFGSAGRGAMLALEQQNFDCLIVDRNVDTITSLHEQGRQAIFGDFTQATIAAAARLDSADLLVITLPSIDMALQISELAKSLNSNIMIIARSELRRYVPLLQEQGAYSICWEDELQHSFYSQVSALAQVHFGCTT